MGPAQGHIEKRGRKLRLRLSNRPVLVVLAVLALLELGAAALRRIWPGAQSANDPTETSRYYQTVSWAEEYWRDFGEAQATSVYAPYRLWRLSAYQGRLIHVGPDGVTRGFTC